VARKSVCSLLAFVLLSAFLLFCSSAVAADASILPLSAVFNVDGARGVAHQPAVVYNPDVYEYLVVWSSAPSEEGDGEIWAQRISQGGNREGRPVPVCDARGDQVAPDVCYCPLSGEYLITWEDHRSEKKSGADVYAQRVGADGQLIGDELVVAAGFGDQMRPRVAFNLPAEEYLIVWYDRGDGADGSDIEGRWLVADGGMAGDGFAICDAAGSQSVPVVAADLSRPRCLVVWEDGRYAAWKGQDIYARFVAPRNELDGLEMPIATSPSPEYSPRVVYNAVTDEYLIVWEDEVSGQVLSGDGQLAGPAFSLFRADPCLRRPSLFVISDSGDWVIAWEDVRQPELHGADIYARWLSDEMRSRGDAVLLSDSGGNQFAPAVAYDGYLGQFLAVWSDDLPGNASLVVRARLFTLVP